VFLSPTTWSARRSELLDDAVVDMLADELLPHLRAWLGDQWRPGRSIALGASLGGITAIRAALRRQDRFAGAVALSAALTDYPLDPPDGQRPDPSRFFLSAGQEEGAITLDDGASLLDATVRVARRLADQGHTVRRAPADGGHTYAAWEAMLPQALSWALGG
jgi:enterochelin esterase-like enzyme